MSQSTDSSPIEGYINKVRVAKVDILLEYLISKNGAQNDDLHIEINSSEIKISGNFWHYATTLIKNLDKIKFKGYFNKTILLYPKFKNNEITNHNEVRDYFRRCQILSIIQLLGIMGNSLVNFKGNSGLIKISPSKNNKKNCVLIDDSSLTEIDQETGLLNIRDTCGTPEEPHRGYKLFSTFSVQQKIDIIYIFNYYFSIFGQIIGRINKNNYIRFDPILVVRRIVNYANKNNMINLIFTLCSEFHDNPYNLSLKEQIDFLNDIDNLYKLWNDGFITDNQGKLRLFMISFYYLELINNNSIIE